MDDAERRAAILAGMQLAYSARTTTAEALHEVADAELDKLIADHADFESRSPTFAALIGTSTQYYRYFYEKLRRAEGTSE
jgi:hypothetical protein